MNTTLWRGRRSRRRRVVRPFMFFFVGGLTKRRVLLGKGIIEQDCLNCLKSSVPELTRDDTWLSIFFIPIIRMSVGQETYTCRWCGSPYDFSLSAHEREVLVKSRRNMAAAGDISEQSFKCPSCKSSIVLLNDPNNDKQLHFCPYCGRASVCNM